MTQELHFYRDASCIKVSKLLIAVITPENANFWNAMDTGEFVYEGEVVHFDTLYEWHQNAILELKDAFHFKYGVPMPVNDPALLALTGGL